MSDAAEEFIKHYGVRGMRWGVRKDVTTGTESKGVTNAGLTGRTKVVAKGGKGQAATKEALEVAQKKQILKKSGTAALSNDDLRQMAERMRLEVEVKRLDQETSSAGRKFLKKKLGSETQRVAGQEVSSFVDKTIREAKNRK